MLSDCTYKCVNRKYVFFMASLLPYKICKIHHKFFYSVESLKGSILGPTLFSFYINDKFIVNDSNFTTRLFADDTVLMLHEKNLSVLNTKVNSELHTIQLWLSKNKLSLNYSKTTYMVIAPKQGTIEKFSVLLDGNELSRCESAKYLGNTIESNLRWNLHIASLCKKLSQSAGIISKLRHFLNFETLKMLYHSFVKSHLLYGILPWGNDYKSAIQPLQILQNKILRLMFKIEPQSNVSNNYLYYSSKLLKIDDLYKLEIAKFMYLYEHNKFPPVFSDYFLPLKKIHCHNTRSSSSNKYF